MASSLFGWACITIALPEEMPLMNGLIDLPPQGVSPAPAPEVGAEVEAEVEVPQRSATKSGLRVPRLRSKKPLR